MSALERDQLKLLGWLLVAGYAVFKLRELGYLL